MQFIEEISPKEPQCVQTRDIEKYLKFLNEKALSSRTVSRKISCVHEFYKFLQSEKIIAENPTQKFHTPKIDKNLPEFLTKTEIEKICSLKVAKENYSIERTIVMIKLMYATGLRVSELVSLQENAINYDMCQILVKGKGNKERIVPVAKAVIQDVLKYAKTRDAFLKKTKNKWLFPSIRSLSGHITRSGFFRNLKQVALLAGLDSTKVHPHILRHSFATQLINNEVDLRSIQKMLGHENISTTEIYTHVTTERLAAEVKKNHPLMKYEDENNEKI
jgi:integrase/recombinase XerD